LLLLACAVVFAAAVHLRDDAPKKGHSSSADFSNEVAITTATAKKGNLGVYLDAIGTVTPVYTSSITSQANGIVTAVNYAEGQM
jgi:multidrug efflux system membrane fusion protein